MDITVGCSAQRSTEFPLAEGGVAVIRPISPHDAEALVRFHGMLSPQTINLRYFYPHRTLAAVEVARLTQVDGRDRVALVVERGVELIGVGRYEGLDDPTQAEVAFVVADAFQHHGIATALLRRLREAAQECGITHFVAEVLAENTAMLSVFHQAGFPLESKNDRGTLLLRMALTSVPLTAAATLYSDGTS
jgi:RimJ/RimL family protein N-acetyltransferase